MWTRLPLLLLAGLLGAGCSDEWGGDDDAGPPGPLDDDDDIGAYGDDDYDEPVCDDYPPPYDNHDIPPGGTVREGVVIDLTPAGLQFIETTALHMDTVVIPMESMTQGLGEYMGCDVSITISGMTAYADITHLAIDPIPHGLDLEVGVLIRINESAYPFAVQIDGDGGIFDICGIVDQTCDLWVEPMNVSLDMTVWLDLVDVGGGAPPVIDATVSTPTHNLHTALTEDAIGLDGCFISTLDDILNFFGTDIVEMLLDEASGELFDYIEGDLPVMVEDAIEGAADSLAVSEIVDIEGGAPLEVSIQPSGLIIEPEGIRVLMDGAFDAPLADCMVDFDTNGSPDNHHSTPAQDPAAHHHASALISDDLINSALYAVWRSGLLCLDADPAELGLPLDTALLALLVDEEDRPRMERLWLGESAPIQIHTVPRYPPMNQPTGPHAIDVEAENLGVDLYAVTQDRLSRVVGLELDVGAGVDLTALGDGTITATVMLDTEHFHPHVCHNDLVPDLSSDIEQNFDELIVTMIEPLLAGLVGDIAIGPFVMGGVGIDSLDVVPTGNDDAFLAAYVDLALVEPSASLGCGDTGCSDGCDDVSCGLDGGLPRGMGLGNLLLGLACAAALTRHRGQR